MGGPPSMPSSHATPREAHQSARELSCLKNLFTMAIKWGKASENPVKQVQLFREDNGRTRFLTKEEEEQLLAHCRVELRSIVIAALPTASGSLNYSRSPGAM